MNWELLLDKTEKLLKWLQRGATLLFIVYSLGLGIYEGIKSGTIQGLISWTIAGMGAASLFALIHLGFYALITTSNWLSDQLKKYPKIRRGILICLMVIVIIIAFAGLFYWQIDNLIKAIIFVYCVIMAPSALISLLQDDRRREQFSLLGSRIAPELVIQNPQAAVEHAFTLFEDHLRRRLNAGTNIYGEALINLAYGQDGKLFYGNTEGENKGARNFISGAYATYRNPRKHRVIEDDKQTALAIIVLVELLIRLVDESIDKDSASTGVVLQSLYKMSDFGQ